MAAHELSRKNSIWTHLAFLKMSYVFYVFIPEYMYVHSVHAGALVDQMASLDHSGTGLPYASELPDVGAGNQIQILWKSSRCF